MIIVRYSSVDGFSQTRRFKTLKGARAFATKWVGDSPDIGRYYAVSFDGIGKIDVAGVSISDLFAAPVACALPVPSDDESDWEGPNRYT